MPFETLLGPVPHPREWADSFQMCEIGRMVMSVENCMIPCGDSHQITGGVVERIAVFVVNVITLRNWSVMSFVNFLMERPNAPIPIIP